MEDYAAYDVLGREVVSIKGKGEGREVCGIGQYHADA